MEMPERYVGNKHDHILKRMVQMMRCRKARITIAKVRAHAGIAGNELADVVAKATVAPTDEVVFTECCSAGRGAAWVRYTHGGV